MHQIETGLRSPQNKDCVFLWLYCLDGEPYAKYLPEGAPGKMPMVMAMLRWDGMFGTIGGKVDAGENLRRALAREIFEEARLWLAPTDEPVPLGTFIDVDWHVHSFALQMRHAELVDVRKTATEAQQNSSECAGFSIIPTGNYIPSNAGEPRGLEAFRRNAFCSTARLEFEQLLLLIQAQTAASAA